MTASCIWEHLQIAIQPETLLDRVAHQDRLPNMLHACAPGRHLHTFSTVEAHLHTMASKRRSLSVQTHCIQNVQNIYWYIHTVNCCMRGMNACTKNQENKMQQKHEPWRMGKRQRRWRTGSWHKHGIGHHSSRYTARRALQSRRRLAELCSRPSCPPGPPVALLPKLIPTHFLCLPYGSSFLLQSAWECVCERGENWHGAQCRNSFSKSPIYQVAGQLLSLCFIMYDACAIVCILYITTSSSTSKLVCKSACRH